MIVAAAVGAQFLHLFGGLVYPIAKAHIMVN